MGLLKEIIVPLLAVNDTSLTVVEIGFKNGQPVKKGDQLMVFETSKTTYEVMSETDGFIQFLCETGKDYEVNTIVAQIFSDASEVAETKPPPPDAVVDAQPAVAAALFTGDPLFSNEALHLINSAGLDKSVFSGKDFVARQDVEDRLGIRRQPVAEIVQPKPRTAAKIKAPLAVDHAKVIVEK